MDPPSNNGRNFVGGVEIMAPQLIIILASCFITLGVYSSNSMFPVYKRPLIFRTRFGDLMFFIIVTIVAVGGVALVIWSFLHIPWYIDIFLIIGSMLGFSLWYGFLPAFLRESALGPIVAAIGLLVLNCFAWS